MQKKYDAILVLDQTINEGYDDRIYSKGGYVSGPKGFTQYPDADDPKLYNAYSFGNMVRQSLGNIGQGFSCNVIDFKKWVIVTITHSNHITGRTSSKTFLIVFKSNKDGIVLSTHNRYRTISGVEQACSYIRSACSALQNDTQSKIS